MIPKTNHARAGRNPESPARLAVAATEVCSRWCTGFIEGEYVNRGANAAG